MPRTPSSEVLNASARVSIVATSVVSSVAGSHIFRRPKASRPCGPISVQNTRPSSATSRPIGPWASVVSVVRRKLFQIVPPQSLSVPATPATH